jgi:hypothetical protein
MEKANHVLCPYCGAEIDYLPPQWETISSPPCGGDPAWHEVPEDPSLDTVDGGDL